MDARAALPLGPRGTAPAADGGAQSVGRVFAWLLSANVLFVFLDQIEPKLLPIILKEYQASDRDVALIVTSSAALMQVFVTPILSYRSDRSRHPQGRRLPYLAWAVPGASLLLALTPYAPEIAAAYFPDRDASRWCRFLPEQPTVLAFAMLTLGFRFFHAIVASMLFALVRDTVPTGHMMRFLALFRMVGAVATFCVTYWLVARAATHAKLIFAGVALCNVIGFTLICRRVSEHPFRAAEASPAAPGIAAAIRQFASESFRHPVYVWTYATRVLVFAALAISSLTVFFPWRELGIPLAEVGPLMAWSAIAWLPFAYPLGRAMERWGAIAVLLLVLIGAAIAHGATFLLVTGPATFLVSSLTTGVLFWAGMLGQTALTQEVFSRERFAQLSSANTLLQALLVAFLIGPAVGTALDAFQGLREDITIPGLGAITIGPYRCLHLLLAAVFVLSATCLLRVRAEWRRLGGAVGRYKPPV